MNGFASINRSRNYLLTNIGQLNGILEPDVLFLKGNEMRQHTRINNAWMMVSDGIIAGFGPMDTCPDTKYDVIDLHGKWVLPGFCDSHTHMVFAAPRYKEYVMRLQGKTYEEIASEGGGILNSASKLRATDEDELFRSAFDNAMKLIMHGTTAIEIKSGYGLDTDSELKMLRVIARLKRELPVTVKATFLGAHAYPAEFRHNHEAYLSMIIHEMLPAIAEQGLADYIDVFCDTGFFSAQETSRLLREGEKYGLRAKIHGNELGLTGGVQVAVEHNALSVDHLEHIGEAEIECLKSGSTMPVALPGSSFFLKIPYTPARRLVDEGLPLAIASDFNPGSSPIANPWLIWSLACQYNGLLPTEALNAFTINAAYAMGLQETHGSITIGKSACLVVTGSFGDLDEIPYWVGVNHAEMVFTG